MKKIYLSKLKESKGFTMLEMILTVALVAIFFTVVAMVLPSLIRSYNSIVSVNYANQIADNIITAVEEQLTYASDVTVDSSGKISYGYPYKEYIEKGGNQGFVIKTQTKEIKLGDSNGDVPIIPGFVYDKKYYMDKKVEIIAKTVPLNSDAEKTKHVCILTVNVSDNSDNLILEKTRNIRLYGVQK